MDLQQWKDKIARDTYNKSWFNLSRFERESLTAKHRVQFYTLAHSNKKRGDRSIRTLTTHSKKGNNMNDNERDKLIIEMHTDLKYLRTDFENHLSHHFKYSFFAWTTAIGLILTLGIMLIKVL